MPKYMTIVKGSETHTPPPPALFEAIDHYPGWDCELDIREMDS